MQQLLKDLWLSAVLALTLWLVYSCSGCAPETYVKAGARTPAVTGASIVTLVRPATFWRWGSLSTEEGLTSSGFAERYYASCNGFAIERAGIQYLATAAHCVSGMKPGDELRYLSPDGIGYGFATLDYVDDSKDLALARSDGLTPLATSNPPGMGEDVLSVSSLYEATSYGRMLDRLSAGYYETTQTIIHGWSGSPVLDARGKVWGIVSQCTQGAHDCEPGRTIVTALP